MGKIQVLPFEVANLIAAGEVVDRPASVLKELLENAIDAGAHAITAEIRHGGVAMIRVSDDGCGMTAEDLPVCLRRHATSKIREAGDLNGIATLGFRGEALAAIAAVTDIRILTKTADAPNGMMLSASGGRVTDISEVGCSNGTTVVVENLFSSVPARRKFLKRDATEAMAATAVMEKVAMSRPDIAFTFLIDGRNRFSTVGDGKLKNTLYAVLGRDFANRLLPVQAESDGITLSGFVGCSDNVRNNRNYQNVFINGRYVKSKTVMAALEKAYTSYIAPERFPVCALFMTIRPDTVDVNVHPAKLEVKFSDERAVFEIVYYGVRSALMQDESRPELEIPAHREKRNPLAAFLPIGEKGKGEQLAVSDELFKSAPPARPVGDPTATARPAEHTAVNLPAYRPQEVGRQERQAPSCPSAPKPAAKSNSIRDALRAMQDEVMSPNDPPVRPYVPSADGTLRVASPSPRLTEEAPVAPASTCAQTAPVCSETVKNAIPEPDSDREMPGQVQRSYRILGEAFRCYVIVEVGDELLLVDKHAAHERILFEQLKAEQIKDGRVASQNLLVGMHIPLSPEEFAAVADGRAEIEKTGFFYEVCEGERSAILRAVPAGIHPMDAEPIFSRMAAELVSGGGDPAVTEALRREKTLYQIACKAAIKGGRLYGDAQIAWLISRVMALPDITVCPHGRPIAIRLSKNQLDRQFDRIQ